MQAFIQNNDLLAFTLAHPQHAEPIRQTNHWATITLEDTGILRIEPQQGSQISLVISAGVHGNETAPMELLNKIVQDILAGRLACSVRLLVIFGNPPAANIGQRFTHTNMNRLFSGAWQTVDNWEGHRAKTIETSISDFFAEQPKHQKLHYDLHTAIRGSKYPKFAVHPFTGDKAYDEQQLALLAAAEIEAVLLSHQPTTTLSYYSYHVHGAQAFTLELGQVAPFGENDLNKVAAMDKVLRALIGSAKLLAGDAKRLKLFQVIDVLTKDAEDYQLVIPADFKNFSDFKQGQTLTHSSLSNYQVKADGDALVFPNTKLPIGQRSGLVVRQTDLSRLQLE
ncbi:succinylglutamate desuccinylase [Marinomonas agarivorans]|nr:succinylglutamate desuccinylase [Marinomonas agarivorans]